MKFLTVFITLTFFCSVGFSKKVLYRKTQNLNFDGSDVDGVTRSPDGAYVHQKRGINFLPLYNIKKKFDKMSKILPSI